MTKPDETDLLDLQASLRADSDGHERIALERRLDDAGKAIKRKMDGGVAPPEFATLSSMLGATEAAREIVTTAWSRFHGRPL